MKDTLANCANKIHLAPMAKVDPGLLASYLNDYDIVRWLARVPFPYTVDDANAFLEMAGDDPRIKAIMVPEGFAGVIGLDPELGYWLAKPFWGKGYITAAARQLLAQRFIHNEDEIRSSHFVGNERSAGVLTRLGFSYTADKEVTPLALRHPVTSKGMSLSASGFWGQLGMPLKTPRMTLRPMQLTDAEDILRIITQQHVARMLCIFHSGWGKDDAEQFIRNWFYHGALPFRLAITDHTGRFLGTIGVGRGLEPPIFYFLDPKVEGQGYGSEVVRCFTDHLFEHFEIDALTADVFADNPASVRILEKTGFRQVGQGMGTSKARLEPAPIVLYRRERQ